MGNQIAASTMLKTSNKKKKSCSNDRDIRLNGSTNGQINMVYTIKIFKETIPYKISQLASR
jgi:hypothetical protein